MYKTWKFLPSTVVTTQFYRLKYVGLKVQVQWEALMPLIWFPGISLEERGHDVSHWNKKSNWISWISGLRSSLLGAGDFWSFEKSQSNWDNYSRLFRPKQTWSWDIMSSSTNLGLTSCISRSLPPKMKHPEMDMCNSCQNDNESNSMSKF